MFLKKIISQLPRHHQEYNLLIQKIVNPSNQPWTSVYCGAGCDLINFLLTTNSTKGYFLDDYCDLDMDQNYYQSHRTEVDFDYLKIKFHIGYGTLAFLERSHQKRIALISELFALRIKEEKILFKKDPLGFKLQFDWKHPNELVEKNREIYFIHQDLEQVESLTRLVNDIEDLNCLYQKASVGLPFLYKNCENYVHILNKKMRQDSFFLTDDFAYSHHDDWQPVIKNLSSHFPIRLKPIWNQILRSKSEQMLRIPPLRGYSVKKGNMLSRYGWDINIRRK